MDPKSANVRSAPTIQLINLGHYGDASLQHVALTSLEPIATAHSHRRLYSLVHFVL
jgi:hypothetical protein